MDEITTIVRRERWLLGILVYRLTELRHLVAADEARFFDWARAEVDDAVARVREAELIRETLMSGAPPQPDEAVGEHYAAMRELLEEVHALTGGDTAFPTLEVAIWDTAVR